jgi:AcrR family transcriptional regulator
MTANLAEASVVTQVAAEKPYNLSGQRIGRKGQATREKILSAALRIIESSDDAPITLSGVAREVSVGMTTLYLYFPDLGDLILAVLTRVMESADAAFMDRLKKRWPDGSLRECCAEFLHAHFEFWRAHVRILHMRNSYADAGDVRFLMYRSEFSSPIIAALVRQMDGQPKSYDAPNDYVATVLLTWFERVATVVTNPTFHTAVQSSGVTDEPDYIEHLINTEADLIALIVRHQRDMNRIHEKK